MTAQRGDFDSPPARGSRFRDQLAEELRRLDWTDRSYRERADALLPLVAAELARVQAAAELARVLARDPYPPCNCGKVGNIEPHETWCERRLTRPAPPEATT